MKRWVSSRLAAVIYKEFIQMRRDRVTFAMMLGIPLIQLILFGFAINMNPRHLPTAIVGNDHSEMSRRILTSMENSSYFQFYSADTSESEANDLLKTGRVQFVVNFPPNFARNLVRGVNKANKGILKCRLYALPLYNVLRG